MSTLSPPVVQARRSRLIPVSALFVYFLATAALALLFGEGVAAVFAIVSVSVTAAVFASLR